MVNPVAVKNMIDANKVNRDKEKVFFAKTKETTDKAWDAYEKDKAKNLS